MCADCGKTSWTLLGGFDVNKYSKCLQRTSGLSLPCARCYAGSGKYGYVHCKGPYLFSWCSDACLDCVDQYQEQLDACVGGETYIVCRA